MNLVLSYIYFLGGGELQENTKNTIFTLKMGKKLFFRIYGKINY